MLDETTRVFLDLWDEEQPIACFNFEEVEPVCRLSMSIGGDDPGVPKITFVLPPLFTGRA